MAGAQSRVNRAICACVAVSMKDYSLLHAPALVTFRLSSGFEPAHPIAKARICKRPASLASCRAAAVPKADLTTHQKARASACDTPRGRKVDRSRVVRGVVWVRLCVFQARFIWRSALDPCEREIASRVCYARILCEERERERVLLRLWQVTITPSAKTSSCFRSHLDATPHGGCGNVLAQRSHASVSVGGGAMLRAATAALS